MKPEEQDQGPPSYGSLIRLAREAQGISPETAAARTPHRISGSTWRQVEKGYKGSGLNRTRVPGKASTVAAMALTVGITADRMAEHHPEAAAIMRERERQEAAQQAAAMPDALRSAPAHVRRMIEVALEDVDPRDRPQLLREMAADYEAVKNQRSGAVRQQRPRRTG